MTPSNIGEAASAIDKLDDSVIRTMRDVFSTGMTVKALIKALPAREKALVCGALGIASIASGGWLLNKSAGELLDSLN